jgi:hypothetical protein
MKLLVRGGSIAAGIGVKRSYVDIMKAANPGMDIINRSRINDNTFHAVWNFHEDIDPFKPEILLIHFGVEDAYAPVYRSEFKENLVQIIRLAKNRFSPDIMLLTSHPLENQYEMAMINNYYRIIREVAMDLGCDYVPMHAYWIGQVLEANSKLSDYLQNDFRYPNELGHELYARAISRKLEGRRL